MPLTPSFSSFGRRSFRLSKRRKKSWNVGQVIASITDEGSVTVQDVETPKKQTFHPRSRVDIRCYYHHYAQDYDVLNFPPSFTPKTNPRPTTDSFVNSQEWTLSRSIPDLRIGILGTSSSGKSALVHRYLTGQYVQDESPDGGRFKKEVNIDGQGFLLLIRDEGGPPALQFSGWVDAVIFVFSVDSEASFGALPDFFSKLRHHRNPFEIPILVVGTRDGLSESSHRVIESYTAEEFAKTLHPNSSYFETSATDGHNVDTVFAEACKRILRLRQHPAHMLSTVGNNSNRATNQTSIRGKENISTPVNHQTPRRLSSPTSVVDGSCLSTVSNRGTTNLSNNNSRNFASSMTSVAAPSLTGFRVSNAITASLQQKSPPSGQQIPTTIITEARRTSPEVPAGITAGSFMFKAPAAVKTASSSFRRKSKPDLSTSVTPLPSSTTKDKDVTPTSTPSVIRKHKRRSHIFPNLTGGGKNKNNDESNKNGSSTTELLGSGRTIPLRQGYLYKKSAKTLNKDWKKKYVTLTSDGTLTYHPTLHDYMSNTHGKEIPLKHTTVKVPGSKFRLSKMPVNPSSGHGTPFNHSISQESSEGSKSGKKEKKHRRTKSNVGKHSEDDSDGAEFTIVSLENKEWRFDAESSTERQGWVADIEKQILSSLQEMESDKSKTTTSADKVTLQGIRTVPGNDRCADCGEPDPVWASLNLGTLICIECSGIHRNLGTHISKVRSLDLDDWSPAQVAVMMSLGNVVVNEIFEAKLPSGDKPVPQTSREIKESFIRRKYENKNFLLPLRVSSSTKQLDQQLIDAISRNDVQTIALILAHKPLSQLLRSGNKQHFPLHTAAATGKLAVCQLLIWNNVDVNSKDPEGKTALYRASQAKHKEIESLLKSSGCGSSPSHVYGYPSVNVLENQMHEEDMFEGSRHLPLRPASAASKTSSSSASFVRRSLKHVLSPRQEDALSKLPSSDI